MKTALDMLKEGFALLADKSKWTTCAYARDAGGRPVNITDDTAHCWCSSGLLMHLDKDVRSPEFKKAYGFLSDAAKVSPSPSKDIIGINDNDGYDCTMLMWQKAIELAQAERTK